MDIAVEPPAINANADPSYFPPKIDMGIPPYLLPLGREWDKYNKNCPKEHENYMIKRSKITKGRPLTEKDHETPPPVTGKKRGRPPMLVSQWEKLESTGKGIVFTAPPMGYANLRKWLLQCSSKKRKQVEPLPKLEKLLPLLKISLHEDSWRKNKAGEIVTEEAITDIIEKVEERILFYRLQDKFKSSPPVHVEDINSLKKHFGL